MSALKVLITSGGGLLGQYLNIELSKKFEILTLYHKNAGNAREYNSKQIDLINLEEVENIVKEFYPDVIVHNAAISNPAMADELPPNYTYKVNVSATEVLAAVAESINARIIYTSTDLVYAGYRGSNLNEDSKIIPASLYSETKMMGEIKVRRVTDNYLILRTALMYGFGLNHSKNHFTHVIEKLKSGESVSLFTDQFRSPLELSDAARMISELIQKEISGETINFGGPERLSRYELGLKACKVFGLDEKLIKPVKLSETDLRYKVYDVSMDISKLLSVGVTPKSVEQSLEYIREKYF